MRMAVAGSGRVDVVMTTVGGERVATWLDDVYHVPSLTNVNFFSVVKACEKGYVVHAERRAKGNSGERKPDTAVPCLLDARTQAAASRALGRSSSNSCLCHESCAKQKGEQDAIRTLAWQCVGYESHAHVWMSSLWTRA